MKPRLEPIPFTDEDCVAWARGFWRLPALSPELLTVLKFYEDADRRDASIMLRIGQTFSLSPPHPTGRACAHSLLSWGMDIPELVDVADYHGTPLRYFA